MSLSLLKEAELPSVEQLGNQHPIVKTWFNAEFQFEPVRVFAEVRVSTACQISSEGPGCSGLADSSNALYSTIYLRAISDD